MNITRLLLSACLIATISLAVSVPSTSTAGPATTTVLPKNETKAAGKTDAAKEIANAKVTQGNEDTPKSIKKGDLINKDEGEAMGSEPEPNPQLDHVETHKNHSLEPPIPAAPVESPSEDAQEDLGVEVRNGTTLPAYQIPEQPKDVIVKKKRQTILDAAVDNALGALFGRPPVDVIEEVTYVDYPDRLYKRSGDNALEELNSFQEGAESAIDSEGEKPSEKEPIAVSKPEVEVKARSDAGKAPNNGAPKMEFGNLVTLFPSSVEEKDFASSVENQKEMAIAAEPGEVADLLKKDVPELEKAGPQINDKKLKDEVGENVDEVKAKTAAKIETKGQPEFVMEDLLANTEEDDEEGNKEADSGAAAGEDQIQPEDSIEGESGEEKAAEDLPLKEHLPKKDSEADVGEKDTNKDSREKDEYLDADKAEAASKALMDAINPESPEIKAQDDATPLKVSPKDNDTSENDQSAAYASELDDDFSVDHKSGMMPAVNSPGEDDDEQPKLMDDDDKPDANYKVLEKLQDDVDAAVKKDENPDYIVVEELKDPIQGHRKYTILKPTYREFHPKDNKLIEEVKNTLDRSKAKRSVKNFDIEDSESFEDSYSKDTVVESSDEEEEDGMRMLKNVADFIEQDGSQKRPKTDQEPMFVPDRDPIPLTNKKFKNKPTLEEILGIPEGAGPVMVEPEGGIPPEWKPVVQLESEDYEQPKKVVIESKNKYTFYYADSSEEAEDSSSSSSSEEDPKAKPSITVIDIPLGREGLAEPKQSPPQDLQALEMSQNPEDHDRYKHPSLLGNNMVIIFSISPVILIIGGVISLTILLFKLYWVLYSPQTAIIPQHTAAGAPKMETPISIVTVDDKKEPKV